MIYISVEFQNDITNIDNGNNSNIHNNNKEYGNKILMDESNFQLWSQKDVLMWLKMQLLENGFCKSVVLQFLREFATKQVTGALKMFKTNPKFLNGFQAQFSKEN